VFRVNNRKYFANLGMAKIFTKNYPVIQILSE
jgi:hypothetical protein